MEKKEYTVEPSDRETESGSNVGSNEVYIDHAAEKSYVRKLDMYLLPVLSMMYFFNSVDRSNLGNAKTDGIDKDLHFTGNEYSYLLLFFYLPYGLLDLPLNLLTKYISGGRTLPLLMFGWGSLALLQCATKNFAGLMAIRLLLGGCEAGFYAGTVFYMALFYGRGELGFRIAIYFGSALLAAAFSGLISFAVFQINGSIPGWMYLFLIEGGLTVIVAIIAYFWLPRSPETAWFLTPAERDAARARSLRDASGTVGSTFNWKECFQSWKDWKFALWVPICFLYTTAFATTSNFMPQFVQRLGYSVVKTNLYTVAPNAVGFVVLLCVAKSSDYFRERTFHIIFSLILALIGMIILATIDVVHKIGVTYFACFLMAAGSYVPTVLVHSWHNNNNLNENSRAATTGLLVGLGNLGSILSAATFRTEFAPKYIPTLAATAGCISVVIVLVLWLGIWMKLENRRRDKEQGVRLRAGDVSTSELIEGENSPKWRYFT